MLGGCGGGYEYLHNPPGAEEESDGGAGCLWFIFLFIILPEIVRAIF